MKCCFCGNEIEGHGNNALPLKQSVCCDHCNNYVVVPARIYKLCKEQGKTEQAKKLIDGINPKASVGAKVLILEMKDEPNYSGKSGIIEHIDDAGQIHGTWGGCALIPSTDIYIIINKTAS